MPGLRAVGKAVFGKKPKKPKEPEDLAPVFFHRGDPKLSIRNPDSPPKPREPLLRPGDEKFVAGATAGAAFVPIAEKIDEYRNKPKTRTHYMKPAKHKKPKVARDRHGRLYNTGD